MRDFHRIETEHGLQAALWNFGAQIYNTGSIMGGMIDPKYAPPAVMIESILQGIMDADKQTSPLKSVG